MATTKTKFSIAIALTAATEVQPSHAQCSAGYQVEIFAAPQCQFLASWAGDARGINSAGDICCGYVDCAEVGHHVIWLANGALVQLPPSSDPGYPDSPFDVNDVGQVVGKLHVPALSPPEHAFFYSDGITLNLGVLPGDNYSEAYAINDDAIVCGLSFNTGTGPLHAFVRQKSMTLVMDLPFGPNSVAYDVSNSGFICGWMGMSLNPHFGGAHAFIWKDGRVIDLGTPLPGSGATEARAVNNQGQACGGAHFAEKFPTGYSRGLFWSDGQMQDVGVLPTFEHSFALDLNDSGVVIGQCSNDFGVGEPFIWQNGVMAALDDLIPPELNLKIRHAWAINNAGQIAGQATRPGPNGTDTVAVRLTPIPSSIGDFNCNNVIDVDDLLGVINHWGNVTADTKPPPPLDPADFNYDKIVNISDLLIVLDNWTM